MTRPKTTMRFHFVLTIILIGLLAGCTLIYKPDIEQGNILTPEMLEKVKTGMTREQVRFVLGSPLITDVFHKNRWDYYYTFRLRGKKISKQSRITVFFKDDRVSHIVRGNTGLNPPG